MWTDNLNVYGLSGTPPVSQDTPLDIANSYSGGSVPATSLSGQLVNDLIVGDAANSDNAVYINSNGVYAGNSIPSSAPFWVDMQGRLVATDVKVQTGSTGSRVVINPDGDSNFPSVEGADIEFFDQNGILCGVLYAVSDSMLLSSDPDVVPAAYSFGGFNNTMAGTSTASMGAGTHQFQITSLGFATLLASLEIDGDVGFYGMGAQPQPTVSGSYSGDLTAVVQSIVEALSGLGLVIDGTTP